MTPNDILDVLNEQVESYRTMLELLRKERKSLLDYNADEIQEISKQKDTLALRLSLLEEERVRLMKKFSGEAGIQEELNLRRLGELTGEDGFLDVRSKLVSLVQGINELNRLNGALIDRSLDHIRKNANFFDSVGLGSTGSKGALVSKET